MNRTMTVLILVFFLPAMALTADDSIKAELDKARTQHTKGLDAAKNKLAAAMDAKLKEVAGKGDLDKAQEVKSQKEIFEKDGSLPTTRLLADAKRSYDSEVRVAKQVLRKAIQKAKEDYTKALKLDEAEVLATELKELAVNTRGVDDKDSEELNAKFSVGSTWKGQVKETKGKKELTADILVTLTERDGTEFKGTYKVGNDICIYQIKGSIEKVQLKFQFKTIEKQPKNAATSNIIGVENEGRLKLDPKTKKPILETKYTWPDANKLMPPAKGTVTLELVD